MPTTLSRRNFLLSLAAATLSAPAIHPANAFSVPAANRIAPLAQQKGVFFGSAIDSSDLQHDDLKALYVDHCTSLTPRNAMKWAATEKRRAKFDFTDADKIVDFAKANNIRVHGHTLVWHNLPGNMNAITKPQELEAVMRRHIQTQVRHFAGKVHAWDVVNEPFEYDSELIRTSIFHKLLGEEYINSALRITRSTDPDATLLINETHLEKQGANFDKKRAAFLSLIDRQLAKGAPLDGIGIQGHFRPGFDSLDVTAFGKFCRELKQRNLQVHITELDASCKFVARDKNFSSEDYGTIFERLILSAAENSHLKAVTVWGLSERYAQVVPSEKTNSCNKRINLYDENDTARSTQAAIVRAFEALPNT
ncbi:endo-1,4-beta-xylanase [Agrobacterium sp. AGB01]|uniref:endo-1,4-beta-xylanase n=1 Tax=Agrobacterium sp. AGB01 TaxID=2769302 RepID=UPI001784C92B|nr:endo-1,4-beta-xylanase [Agrobacterium sp. AGB01]MBD9388217.1 endo-1,4-beta-xylanase [Agrobacterium sp. AGB01]